MNENVVSLNIQNANIGQIIPTTMYGVILETNINKGDDGGLYAELVFNRAFQGRSFSYNICVEKSIMSLYIFRKWTITCWMVVIWRRINCYW